MFVRVNQRVINGGNTVDAMIFLETEFETMEQLHEALVQDGSIIGTRYWTRSGARQGEYIVTTKGEFILCDFVVSIMEMAGTLYDERGRTIWPPTPAGKQ